jgi:hypothetical protein
MSSTPDAPLDGAAPPSFSAAAPPEAAPARKKPGRMRRLLGLAALLGLLLLALGLAPRLIPTAWIRDLVVTQVRKHTGRACSLDDIHVGWLDGVSVSGLRIEGEPGEPPLVKADRISLKVDLRALLERRLVIERVLLDGTHIAVIRRQDGSGGDAFAVAGCETRVRNSSVLYRDQRAGIDTTWLIEDLTLRGPDLNGPLEIQGTLAPKASEPLGSLHLSEIGRAHV